VSGWGDATFLNKAKVLKQGVVTQTALLLLGRPESAALLSPAVAKISWILKDADNHELTSVLRSSWPETVCLSEFEI
jgi:ATP-dependent DNA helicase RecG